MFIIKDKLKNIKDIENDEKKEKEKEGDNKKEIKI